MLIVFGSVAHAQARPTEWVEVFATNDRHGHLEFAAQLGGLLQRERSRLKGSTVLLDAGDLFTGTLESDLGEGAPVIRAMNALGYDAAAVGNHDFDFGPVGPDATPRPGPCAESRVGCDDPRGALKARSAEARFPLLMANIVDAQGRTPSFARAFVVIERGGVKIGVVGGATEETPRTTMAPNLAGLRVEPLAPSLARAAALARKAGADLVVAVVHAGGECNRRPEKLSDAAPGDLRGCKEDSEIFRLARLLAQRPPEERVNALVGGHTHQQLTAVVAGIPIIEDGFKAATLAHLGIEVDARTHRPTGAFVIDSPLSVEGVPPDAKVAAAVAADIERAAARRAERVGVTLDGKLWRAHGAESPFGNLVADVVREAAHADVGLMNGGGLRTDLPAGELTYGALFEALPFANRLATVRMRGAQLKRMLARNLRGDHGLLSIAGAAVEAHCGQGAPSVEVVLASGKRVADTDELRVGTNDFLALGGDDFSEPGIHGTVTVDEEGPPLRDRVAAALKLRGTVRSADLFDPAHPRIRLPGCRGDGLP